MLSRRAFIAGTALVACQPSPAMKAAPAGADPSDMIVLADGVPIRLNRTGRGRPVCLIHGASGNLNDMTYRLAPALADRYTVIAVDRPGHGRSGMPPGGGASINAQAALLRAAMAGIGIERPLLVGHSYGGSVALAWAVDAPESISGLVLLATPSQVWKGGLGLTTDLIAAPVLGPVIARIAPNLVTRGFAESALATVFAPQVPPEGYLDHLDLALVLQPRSLRANARQLVTLKEELRPMVPAYPRLKMPVEIVHGEADVTVGLELHSAALARQIPRAGLVRLPSIGHMPHQVATQQVVDRIQVTASRL